MVDRISTIKKVPFAKGEKLCNKTKIISNVNWIRNFFQFIKHSLFHTASIYRLAFFPSLSPSLISYSVCLGHNFSKWFFLFGLFFYLWRFFSILFDFNDNAYLESVGLFFVHIRMLCFWFWMGRVFFNLTRLITFKWLEIEHIFVILNDRMLCYISLRLYDNRMTKQFCFRPIFFHSKLPFFYSYWYWGYWCSFIV